MRPRMENSDIYALSIISKILRFLRLGHLKAANSVNFFGTLLSPGAIDYSYCNYRGIKDLSSEPFCVWIQWQWKEISGTRHDALNTLCYLTVGIWSYNVLFGQDRWDFFIESTDGKSRFVKNESMIILLMMYVARLASELRLYRPPQVDALSPSNIAFIQQQLGAPRREVHHRSVSGVFLPRRLVDLGVVCDSPPRLVDSSDTHTGGGSEKDHTCKYATLSYCWGPPIDANQQLKLTRETRNRFHKEIPLESMSPVLKDTIIVCRALHIRYIWIDALCILQGDKTDWEEQSNQMDQIFQHSYVTICTPASSSCMQGFLHRTGKNCRPSIRIGYIDEASNDVLGAYSLRPALDIGQKTVSGVHPFVFPRLPAEQRDLALSSWAFRGWVFQERFLSSTQIIFGATMLHVLRDGVIVSESGETSSKDLLLDARIQGGELSQMNSITSRGRHVPDCWYGMVEQYCTMEWTEKLDLFPALSGVAGFFELTMHDQYLAGLWEKDLHCGLLWHTGTARARSPSSLGELLGILNSDGLQVGPSWSWASRPDFYQFDISPRVNTRCRVRTHLRPEFNLLNSNISTDGVNPRGRVKRASLKVSGLMIRLRARCFPNTKRRVIDWKYKTSEGYRLSIMPDWDFWRYEENNEEDIHVGDDGELQLLLISSCCSDWPTQICENPGYRPLLEEAEDHDWVTFKPHYRRTFLEDDEKTFEATADCSLCSENSRRRDIWGLLVYPAGPEGTYYRVGVFICRAELGGSDLFKGVEAQTLELL